MVLRGKELRGNKHRLRARCCRERYLQRLWRADPGASGHTGEDHGGPEGAESKRMRPASVERVITMRWSE